MRITILIGILKQNEAYLNFYKFIILIEPMPRLSNHAYAPTRPSVIVITRPSLFVPSKCSSFNSTGTTFQRKDNKNELESRADRQHSKSQKILVVSAKKKPSFSLSKPQTSSPSPCRTPIELGRGKVNKQQFKSTMPEPIIEKEKENDDQELAFSKQVQTNVQKPIHFSLSPAKKIVLNGNRYFLRESTTHQFHWIAEDSLPCTGKQGMKQQEYKKSNHVYYQPEKQQPLVKPQTIITSQNQQIIRIQSSLNSDLQQKVNSSFINELNIKTDPQIAILKDIQVNQLTQERGIITVVQQRNKNESQQISLQLKSQQISSNNSADFQLIIKEDDHVNCDISVGEESVAKGNNQLNTTQFSSYGLLGLYQSRNSLKNINSSKGLQNQGLSSSE